MQYNSHVNARIDWILQTIYEALGINPDYDLGDWYSYGDELR